MRKRQLNAALLYVAERLGNTLAIGKNSYVRTVAGVLGGQSIQL